MKTLRIRVQTQLLFPEQALYDPPGKVCKGLANPIRTQPGLVQPAGGGAEARGGGVRLAQQFILPHWLMEGPREVTIKFKSRGPFTSQQSPLLLSPG